MPVQPVIDTAIGLALVFYLMALLTSAAVEAVANLVNKRAKYLLRGLDQLLGTSRAEVDRGGKAIARRDQLGAGQGEWNPRARWAITRAQARIEKSLYRGVLDNRDSPKIAGPVGISSTAILNHGLVLPLWQAGPSGTRFRLPSYVPARTLATAMVDLLGVGQRATPGALRKAIVDSGLPKELQQALVALVATPAAADALNSASDRFRAELEQWIDAQMQRVSGAYKRWAKRLAAVIAIALAAGWHVDAIAVATALWTDEAVRAVAVAAATNPELCVVAASASPSASPTTSASPAAPASPTPSTSPAECVQNQISQLQGSGLPIGPQQWIDHPPQSVPEGLSLVVGLLLAGLAASMGAPFWFDVMNKFISVRNAGVKPQSGEDG